MLRDLAAAARELGISSGVYRRMLEDYERAHGIKLVIRPKGAGGRWRVDTNALGQIFGKTKRLLEDRVTDVEASIQNHERRLVDVEALVLQASQSCA